MRDDAPPSDSAARLFERFLAEEPDGDAAGFDAWLAARGATLADDKVSALAHDVLGRLDEAGSEDQSVFAPPPTEAPATSRSSFAPGQRLGRFALKRLLGTGGMGQVWEAEDVDLERSVALKLLLPGRVDERALEQFAREARAGGRLRHPNLVTTYAYGWDEGLSWIAQELVEGAWTLKDFVDEHRRREVVPHDYYASVAELVAQLADGLHAAHEAGVVHRDVKPANVLVGPDGVPRLTDFGLARVADESALSRTGDVAGTWAYMSPEQVRGRRRGVDRRTDVFSLGAVLYELLTLRRAFDGDTVQRTAEKVLLHDPPDATTVRSGCPRDLALVCRKALEKAPERRYQTAAAFAEDLRRHLADEPILARPPGAADHLRRWVRRNPTPTAVGAVGLVALVILGALLAQRVADVRALERLADERDQEAARADGERRDVLRLSAAFALEELEERQAELWPPHPARLDDLRAWVADAEALLAGLPTHRAKRTELEARLAANDASPEDEASTRWWIDRLATLIADLDAFRDGVAAPDAADPAFGWSVPKRIAFAERLEAEFAPGGRLAERWAETLPALAEAYPDLEVAPVLGLVPLGPDPASGLWEFAHLASGAAPERDAEGRLVHTDDMGVVLVLLTGGATWIGAQSEDPDGPNYLANQINIKGHRPLREVTLSPYLVSKYELTQGQWERLTGANPSSIRGEDGATKPLHPVESLTWGAMVETLQRFDLTLPSEAQWEHACRAGSQAEFTFGDDEAARNKVNLTDRTAVEAGLTKMPGWENHDDGFAETAPVGALPANAFGLHEVHGNVYELCLDGGRWGPHEDDESTVDPLVDPASSDNRVARGGSFHIPDVGCRSHFRMSMSLGGSGWGTGCRPARSWPF